jgi:hypothetical protein
MICKVKHRELNVVLKSRNMKSLILIGLMIPAGFAFSQQVVSGDKPVIHKKIESKRFQNKRHPAAEKGMKKNFHHKVKRHENMEIRREE